MLYVACDRTVYNNQHITEKVEMLGNVFFVLILKECLLKKFYLKIMPLIQP